MQLPEKRQYCAYAIALMTKKASLIPETHEIRDGKLYLYYTSWDTN